MMSEAACTTRFAVIVSPFVPPLDTPIDNVYIWVWNTHRNHTTRAGSIKIDTPG